MDDIPSVLVLASGEKEEGKGGSGFKNLVLASRNGKLRAKITAVASNHENGGVRTKAKELGIPFIWFQEPWNERSYQALANYTKADFFALSGWLKLVVGLDLKTRFNSKTVFNIHPGPLPQFGGPGMYGHHVHEAVMAAFRQGRILHSAVCMHFVTTEYDRGPVFFRFNVRIRSDDTPESLAKRVNEFEHIYQPLITNLVVNNYIRWGGINPHSLITPFGYEREMFEP